MCRFTVCSLLVLLAACGPETGPAADPGELMQADLDFAAATAERGSDGWAEWFADDGAVVRAGPGEIRGREAVRGASVFLDDPAVTLSWEPERAEVAASGDLGWTTGPWVLSVRDSTGAVSETRGRYVSIWRRDASGAWKVAMDLGAEVEDAASSAEDTAAPARPDPSGA